MERDSCLIIGDLQVTFFSDLSNIIQKRRNFKCLTSVLCQDVYQWGFSFKLVVTYNRRKIIIRTLQEAGVFLAKIQAGSEEGEVLALSLLKVTSCFPLFHVTFFKNLF